MINKRVFFSQFSPYFPYAGEEIVGNCLEKFSQIYDSSNEQKIDILFKNYINIAYLETFNTKPDSLENAWERLRQRISTERKIEFKGLEKLSKSWEEMSVASRYLAQMVDISFVKEGNVNRNYDGGDLIINSTEFGWYQECPSIPLTTLKDDNKNKDLADIQDLIAQCPYREGKPSRASRLQKSALFNGNRDSAAAMMLTTPFIDNGTLFHEVGCWNGAHSLNSIAYCSSLRGCFPTFYVGTDINYAGLGLSKMSFSYFNLPLSKSDFFLANSRRPLGLYSVYPIHRIVKVALRVIPVLDLTGIKEFLYNARKEIGDREAFFVLSYALPKGKNYTDCIRANSTKILEQKEEENFITFLNMGSVHQTFCTEDTFNLLADEIGFKSIAGIVAEEEKGSVRKVALLAPKTQKLLSA